MPWQIRTSEQACVELRFQLEEHINIIHELHARIRIIAALGLKNVHQVAIFGKSDALCWNLTCSQLPLCLLVVGGSARLL